MNKKDRYKDDDSELSIFDKILLLVSLIICVLGFALWVYGIFQVGLNPTG